MPQTESKNISCEGEEKRNAAAFCTCTDLQCPCHPSNHDQGCNLCILKNLRQKEIPSCFFHDIDCEKPTPDWHYADFAALVLAAQAKEQVNRISSHEKLLDMAEEILSREQPQPEDEKLLRESLSRLEAYYVSENWKQDFAADEAGMLPEGMKRGVLSEDGIDRVLEDGKIWLEARKGER